MCLIDINVIVPTKYFKRGNANWDCAKFPNTWKHQLPQITAGHVRSFERQRKKFCSSEWLQSLLEDLSSPGSLLRKWKGFYPQASDWRCMTVLYFIPFSFFHSLTYFLFLHVYFIILQFLVLAMWIKIPIRISLEKKKNFNYLGALGHGAWQAWWSRVKAEALCACNRRWRGYLSV